MGVVAPGEKKIVIAEYKQSAIRRSTQNAAAGTKDARNLMEVSV